MSLELEEIYHSYPGSTAPVLRNLNLTVPAGSVVGLTAPSGSGKSTALEVAALLLRPDAGRVLVNGRPADGDARAARTLRGLLGFVPQSPRAFADPRLTLAATICAPAAFREGLARPKPGRYRALVKRVAAEARLPVELLDRKPGQVSDGQLQRALLARALVLDPAVLICDEPTAQLDARTTEAVLGALRARAEAGAAVLIASHDEHSLVSVCDEVHELGQLQDCSPEPWSSVV